MRISALLICSLFFQLAFGQFGNAPENWFHLDIKSDSFPGISSDLMHEKLTAGRKGQKVVVAVIDSGVDIEHEDLDDVLWVNEDEIPGNGIDDDNNGYIDDIHGWNFLGNKNGENVQYDNLEMTRIYAKLKPKYENVAPESLSGEEKEEYETYKEYKEKIASELEESAPIVENCTIILQLMDLIEMNIGKEEITVEDFKNFKSGEEMVNRAAQAIYDMVSQSGYDYAFYKKALGDECNYYKSKKYHYDPELNSREIVKDNFADPYEIGYGNNDVEGPDAMHGTHVAGIIAAERNNGMGMNGVADNVEIMVIRAVPDGDERDKDVANAIRYAVDNGATVVNMSFGKGASPRKGVVDEAVKYAMKNDVLLIHAAGNAGQKNEHDNNYPNDRFLKKGLFGPRFAKNWIEVGANDYELNDNLPASFSNYSQEIVDVFAPGVSIYSTVLDGEYEYQQGTSMAAPVVSGVAATIRSYFPDLSAEQVKEVLLQSSRKHRLKVRQPGTGEMVPFSNLSASGGIVNAYEAFKLAETVKGKRKKKHKQKSKGTNGKSKSKSKDKAIA